MTFSALWMVAGLAVGFAGAYGIRRLMAARAARRQAAAPPVFTSRQQRRQAGRTQKTSPGR